MPEIQKLRWSIDGSGSGMKVFKIITF